MMLQAYMESGNRKSWNIESVGPSTAAGHCLEDCHDVGLDFVGIPIGAVNCEAGLIDCSEVDVGRAWREHCCGIARCLDAAVENGFVGFLTGVSFAGRVPKRWSGRANWMQAFLVN